MRKHAGKPKKGGEGSAAPRQQQPEAHYPYAPEAPSLFLNFFFILKRKNDNKTRDSKQASRTVTVADTLRTAVLLVLRVQQTGMTPRPNDNGTNSLSKEQAEAGCVAGLTSSACVYVYYLSTYNLLLFPFLPLPLTVPPRETEQPFRGQGCTCAAR